MTQPLIWTVDMDAALRHGFEVGQPNWMIADIIGVGDGSIRNRAKTLGLRKPCAIRSNAKERKPTRVDNELRFADMLADGFSPQQAGDALGYASGNSVLQRIRAKLGWQAV
jgi:hypothetical protein